MSVAQSRGSVHVEQQGRYREPVGRAASDSVGGQNMATAAQHSAPPVCGGADCRAGRQSAWRRRRMRCPGTPSASSACPVGVGGGARA